ncbi:thioredoxin-like domain-containing protein [Flavobacterium sp. MFBS3-15]|uniref:thioredoxin-like domain-containing protein n=1 Tax=Flavobacterium sp. MFBS3-15 TaxID=2989816 RepID=UPI0022367C3C|nr:thioredoxin-like domain-containing protein [Flavobacterium sp. MFBS3-15]MCW4468847.1 thioredoxin-like domain-containing protein [Flavobacterium sp. MFBS3-15]
MQNFITALKAEHIKKKGTGIYMLGIILGAIVPVIITIVEFFDDSKPGRKLPYNYYLQFIESGLDAFTQFFFPLLIIITVSRITQLDHRNGGWQLMETQPLRKTSIYFSKFTVILIANFIAILTYIAVSYLGAFIFSLFVDLPKDATTEFAFKEIMMLFSRLFLVSLFISAFQYFISVLLPSFIWSILIGFFLLLLFIFLNVMNVVPDWYPMEMLSKIATYKKGSQLGYWVTYSEAVGVLCSIITLYMGFEWYRHKLFKRAFFGNAVRMGKLVAVLAVFGGLLAYTLSPNTMALHNRTVISGKITGDAPIKNIYLIGAFAEDTIATIPVMANTFHGVIGKDIIFDTYTLAFGERASQGLVLSNNDSVFVDLKMYGANVKSEVTGTRLAENQYQESGKFGGSTVLYYMQENIFMDEPAMIAKMLVDEWKDEMKASDKFRTVDNYVPREDFLERNRKALTIEHLNVWNGFVKKREAMFPDAETPETDDIKAMKARVPMDDETMLGSEAYFKYVRAAMIAGNKDDIDENTKSLLAIAKMKPGNFRDKMLYWQLNTSIKEASSSAERQKLLADHGGTFANKKFYNNVAAKYKLIESLGKGMPAPQIAATDMSGKPFDIASLKGKYVAIDVWATWCVPCRDQSPKFEKFAIKYKNEPIQFVAVSIDRNREDWIMEAKNHSKSVLQLYATNEKLFSKQYDIQYVPRFILMDPEGNFVESQMAMPVDKNFEKLLRETLGLPEQK